MKSHDSNWGRWGDADERGALNLVTPEVTKAAARSVRTGKVYSLGIPIQSSGIPLFAYRGTPMRFTLLNESDEEFFTTLGAAPGTGANEDFVQFASHTASHIDALCHVYEEKQHYNGVSESEMKTQTGAGRLGIEKVEAIATRAVLLDIAGFLGKEWLEPGYKISGDELDRCARAEGVDIRPGWVVLIRTGYLDFWFANQNDPGLAQPGIGADAARWLAAKDVVAVGADNGAVEVVPFDGDEFLCVHKILIVRRGIYLMEHLNLAQMGRDRCFEGFITVAPLKVTGATGSPVNPIVIG